MSEKRIRVKKFKLASLSEEFDWETENKRASRRGRRMYWVLGAIAVVVMLVTVGGTAWYIQQGDKPGTKERAMLPIKPEEEEASEISPDEDLLEKAYLAADKVARAFLAEPDPEKRLQWVRNPDEVRGRMSAYPEEARSEVGSMKSMMEHKGEGVGAVTAFIVSFPSGTARLLEVVGTEEGAKVDWDAYARYGTAGWDALRSGEKKEAVVRVFCEPSTARSTPFEKESEWTGFWISSDDMEERVLGYARVGSLREARMREAVMATPMFDERFTLEIVRHEGGRGPVYEITRCLAVGWVVKGDLEAEWERGETSEEEKESSEE